MKGRHTNYVLHRGTHLEIFLAGGHYTKIDPEDWSKIKGVRWCRNTCGKTAYVKNAKLKVQLHRFLLGLQKGDKRVVDHINGDGLDNRRANIRLTSTSVNTQRATWKPIGRSRYRGVYWDHKGKRWRGIIQVHKRQIHLGLHNTEREAAEAYDLAARQYYGKDAWVNFS